DFTPAEHPERWAARLLLHAGEKSGGQRALDLASLLVAGALLRYDTTPSASRLSMGVTMKGWEQVRELRRTTGRGDQAFVAMWFHDDMTAVFQDGIRPALEQCGYVPYRVDMANHNNRIDDE